MVSSQLDREERDLYIFAGYGLVWAVVWGIATHFLGRPVGSGVTAFIWALGFWFLPVRRRPLRFPIWLAWSAVLGVVAWILGLGLEQLFSLF